MCFPNFSYGGATWWQFFVNEKLTSNRSLSIVLTFGTVSTHFYEKISKYSQQFDIENLHYEKNQQKVSQCAEWFQNTVSPYWMCAGESRMLHLHSGLFGRSQTATIGLYCCQTASTEWSVLTRCDKVTVWSKSFKCYFRLLLCLILGAILACKILLIL